MAADTARQAARTLLGCPAGPGGCRPMSSFWSDQLGLRIQAFDAPALADERWVAAGDLDGDLALACSLRGRLVGVVGIGQRRQVNRLLQELLAGASIGTAGIEASSVQSSSAL